MPEIELICCPYDSGRKDWRCGKAPERILRQGLIPRLESLGASVSIVEIDLDSRNQGEIMLAFALQRKVAEACRNAVQAGRFPLILSGNCNTTVGALAGIGAGDRSGLLWFDAHGDYCTPETTESGFLDGMALAMAAGKCWRQLLSALPGYQPLAEDAIALIGARDLDHQESIDLQASAITTIGVPDLRDNLADTALTAFLDGVEKRIDSLFIHIDLDVLDGDEFPVSRFNVPGGLWPDDIRKSIDFIASRLKIVGATLGSYDPAYDPDGKTAEVAVSLASAIVNRS